MSVEAQVKEEIEIKEPSMYKVVLHNDDVTTFDFVIFILTKLFHMDFEEAAYLTTKIHVDGYGVAGVFTKEVASEKQSATVMLATTNGFPLKATVEEE